MSQLGPRACSKCNGQFFGPDAHIGEINPERNVECIGLSNFHKWFGCAAKDEIIRGVSAGVEGGERDVTGRFTRPSYHVAQLECEPALMANEHRCVVSPHSYYPTP
jgi:hypothetical protein